ncbi:MAG TPA: O-antigen ligase family protein [Verrucomicrobiae bacterium]|nr:O-antigen ligase family protein [Verrucomicrobiae bacterium]
MKRSKNAFVFGVATVAFLAPLKFGTPVMLQSLVELPRDGYEWLFYSWPNELIVILVFAGLVWLVLDPQRMLARIDLLFALPLLFLLTQALAAPTTICPQTTIDTLMLFATCVLLFYVGAWNVRDGAATSQVFGGLALAMLVVCLLALDQHLGGLEETREYLALYGGAGNAPKDFLLRMSSNRVFATFVYPNALAGFLVIAFAPVLAWILAAPRTFWNKWLSLVVISTTLVGSVLARSMAGVIVASTSVLTGLAFWDEAFRRPQLVRWIAAISAGALMVFCLLLTGSRGGFVAFCVVALTTLWCRLPKRNRRSVIAAGGLVVALLVVFVLGQRGGLMRFGTKSLEARMDYWRGAVAIAKDHPWVGTGPGTFGSIYPKYKTASTEEPRAVHNNFLEMWSDSGVAAFVVFALLWAVGVRDAFRLTQRRRADAASVAICASLAGWTVHGLVDFDLYVPGLALPAFILLGAVQGLKELPRTDTVPVRRQANRVVGLGCTIMLLAVLWVEGRSLAAGLAHSRAEDLEKVAPRTALEEARRATELAPWNSYYRLSVGNVAFLAGRPDEAIAAYCEAVEGDPYRSSYWWQLAGAQMATHGVDGKALQLLERAVELNPTNPRYRQALAAAKESVRHSPRGLLESSPTKEERFSE